MHVPPACLLLQKSGCKNKTVWKRVPITKEINLLQFLKLWYRCITLLYMFCGLVRESFSSTDCGFSPKSSIPSQITIPASNLLVLVSGRAIMMCAFLLYDPKKEKRSSQPVHPYSYRAWQKLPLSCPMYRAFTESSLHPANEDECLLGRKRLAVINFPKIIRVRHATWTLGLLMAALEWTGEGWGSLAARTESWLWKQGPKSELSVLWCCFPGSR